MTFTKLFGKMDSMGVYGFMPVWFLFFFVSFGVMIMDDSVGVSRDFCAVSQIICCFNLCAMGYAVTNNMALSKANLLTGPLDMFVTWTAFAYYGGTAVFSSTPIGIFNNIQVPIMALMTIPTLIGLISVAKDPAGYQRYLAGESGSTEGV
tara:strand:+ start:981 stop:1430 length:450 start_codon:yes stop_codon:yes gene_type:complete